MGGKLPTGFFLQSMNSITQQAKGLMLDPRDLAPSARAYNAGIAEHDGRRWMVYRHEPPGGGLCRIRIAEIGGGWAVHSDELVSVPETPDGDNLEDPRLFSFRGGLYLAWTAAKYGATRGWTCRQFYGRIERTAEGWAVTKAYAPKFGKNDGKSKEKNWQFFEHDGRLMAQYEPHHVIEIEGDRVRNQWRTKALPWKWGRPSGGTPPVRFAPGQLITFFHAYEHDPIYRRRYNMAALVFEDHPPFRHIAVSSAPMVIASESDRLPGEGWQPLCIFPCGAVRDTSGAWAVSCGVNDMDIALLSFRTEQLGLVDPHARLRVTSPTMHVRVMRPIYHGGGVVRPPDVVELPSRRAIDLVRRSIVIPQPAYSP